MTATLTVTNLENNTVWKQRCTNKQAQSFDLRGRSLIAPFKASLMVVRTNNWNSFATDFFLPTTMNHAIKATTCKVIAMMAALILDIFTFPIRLITLIPRVVYNTWQGKVPLHKYLLSKDVDPKLLAANTLRVKLMWDEPSRKITGSVTEADGTRRPIQMVRNPWKLIEKDVNLIEIPGNGVPRSLSMDGENDFYVQEKSS